MLAVNVDYEAQQATIGTARGQEVPTRDILDALKSIGYTGRVASD